MVMLRKYCEVHDSLWAYSNVCEAAAIEEENRGHVSVECRFITVDLVRKPVWITFK